MIFLKIGNTGIYYTLIKNERVERLLILKKNIGNYEETQSLKEDNGSVRNIKFLTWKGLFLPVE